MRIAFKASVHDGTYPGYLELEPKIGQIKGNIRYFEEDIDKIALIGIWIFSQHFLRNVIYYPLFGQFSIIFVYSFR